MKEVSLKRKELYILLILGLFLIVFLQYLLGMPGLIWLSFVIVVALIGIFLLFGSTVKWKLLSYFFFVWLLLEGIFRKWILPGYATELFFVKHLLLLGSYFYIFTKGIRISKRDYPFFGLLLTYLVWGVFEAINFRVTTDFRVQILGLITHFWFVPLVFLIPMVFDTEEKILKFFKATAYISIPICALGIVQYFSPYSSPINRYTDPDKHIAMVGDYVRITGVFPYISPYTTYLGFSLMVILYLLIIRRVGKFETLVLSAAISLGAVNVVMSGSRGAVFTLLIKASPFLVFSLKGRIKVRKRIFARLVFAIPLLIFVLLYTDIGSKALSALIERTRTFSYDVGPRLMDTYTPFKFLPEAGLIGYGIGTAYQGAEFLVNDWGDMPRAFEDEWERLVLEIGLVGFIIVMLMRIYIFFYSWKVFRTTRLYELKLIALLILLYQVPVFLGLNIVFNYFEGIIYWSLIGLLVTVSRVERNNATKGSGIYAR